MAASRANHELAKLVSRFADAGSIRESLTSSSRTKSDADASSGSTERYVLNGKLEEDVKRALLDL
jgi:hypothetical protein